MQWLTSSIRSPNKAVCCVRAGKVYDFYDFEKKLLIVAKDNLQGYVY